MSDAPPNTNFGFLAEHDPRLAQIGLEAELRLAELHTAFA